MTRATYSPAVKETRIIEQEVVVLEVSPKFAAMLYQLHSIYGIGGHPDTTLRGEWDCLAKEIALALPRDADEYYTGLPPDAGFYFQDNPGG